MTECHVSQDFAIRIWCDSMGYSAGEMPEDFLQERMIQDMVKLGLVTRDDGMLRLTEAGYDFAGRSKPFPSDPRSPREIYRWVTPVWHPPEEPGVLPKNRLNPGSILFSLP